MRADGRVWVLPWVRTLVCADGVVRTAAVALGAAGRVVCLAHAFCLSCVGGWWRRCCPMRSFDCHETVVTMSGGPALAAHDWLVARADVALVISPAVARAVERLGRTPMPLGNGIEVERFVAEPSAGPQ